MPEMQERVLEHSKEEEKTMKIEDAQILWQLADTMEEIVKKMEQNYGKRDLENFEKSKKALLELQKQIKEVLKWH